MPRKKHCYRWILNDEESEYLSIYQVDHGTGHCAFVLANTFDVWLDTADNIAITNSRCRALVRVSFTL